MNRRLKRNVPYVGVLYNDTGHNHRTITAQNVGRRWTEEKPMIDKTLRKATGKQCSKIAGEHCGRLQELAEALCGDLPERYCPETERVIDGE